MEILSGLIEGMAWVLLVYGAFAGLLILLEGVRK